MNGGVLSHSTLFLEKINAAISHLLVSGVSFSENFNALRLKLERFWKVLVCILATHNYLFKSQNGNRHNSKKSIDAKMQILTPLLGVKKSIVTYIVHPLINNEILKSKSKETKIIPKHH